MDDTIEKVLGYIFTITGIIANMMLIRANRKPKPTKRHKKRK